MKWYSTSKTVASPVKSNGPVTVSFAQPPATYVEIMVPSIDLFMPSPFTPSQTPPNEQIKQAVEDLLASNGSLVPSDQIDHSLSVLDMEQQVKYSLGQQAIKSTLSKLCLGKMENRCCSKKLISMRFCQTCKDNAYQKSMDSLAWSISKC